MSSTSATTAAWLTKLQTALSQNQSPTARWPSLATVTLANTPASRIIAYRGLVSESPQCLGVPQPPPPRSVLNSLVFTTDARSAKVGELARTPHAELCWYFGDTRQQFRLTGKMRVVLPPGFKRDGADPVTAAEHGLHGGVDWEKLRAIHFTKMSPKARVQFVSPPPGSPLVSSPDQDSNSVEEIKDDNEELTERALRNFALLVFEVKGADHLDLSEHPNRRSKYAAPTLEDGEWTVTRVNA
ncbi:hypothetical protein HKX48_005855 [Thoreauomyces humboldtii]|nr:hypothetical protein HKX48_005855 [Thoreauomyces humboldtii]